MDDPRGCSAGTGRQIACGCASGQQSAFEEMVKSTNFQLHQQNKFGGSAVVPSEL